MPLLSRKSFLARLNALALLSFLDDYGTALQNSRYYSFPVPRLYSDVSQR